MARTQVADAIIYLPTRIQAPGCAVVCGIQLAHMIILYDCVDLKSYILIFNNIYYFNAMHCSAGLMCIMVNFKKKTVQ